MGQVENKYQDGKLKLQRINNDIKWKWCKHPN